MMGDYTQLLHRGPVIAVSAKAAVIIVIMQHAQGQVTTILPVW